MKRLFCGLSFCLVVGVGASGCGGAVGGEVEDAAYIQILRLRISKVRYAIAETRETIARSSGAPYLPELYLRLAELLSEEARYHYRVAFEREGKKTETLHVPQVRLLKEQSIGVYESILRNYPESGVLDRALLNLAQEHRELGNFDKMIETLQRLSKDFPQSPLRAHAELILGDYHFDKSELGLASEQYQSIIGGPDSEVKAVAHYKQAWVNVNEGDCKRAIGAFEDALELTKALEQRAQRAAEDAEREAKIAAGLLEENEAVEDASPESGPAAEGSEKSAADVEAQKEEDEKVAAMIRAAERDTEYDGSVDVRRAALVDLVYCYSQERKAAGALSYLRRRAHDRESYVAALGRLARRYGVMDEGRGALAVLRELLLVGPSNKDRIDDARQLHAAIRATKDFSAVESDVELLTDTFTRHVSRVEVGEEGTKQLFEEFEVYVRDVLTRSQDTVSRQPKVKQRRAALRVAAGYEAYIRTFKGSPQMANMMLNAGDMYDLAEEPFKAGQYALRASIRLGEGEGRRNVLYDAVVRLQDALALPPGALDLARRQIARSSLRRAASELLRFSIDKKRERIIKFAIAQSYYDEGRYVDAIDRLTAVAYEFPASEEAVAAVRLVLDSYNTTHEFEGLAAAGQRFMASGSPTPSLRAEIKTIVDAAEQRSLDEVSLAAAGEDNEGLDALLEVAKSHKGTGLGERALLSAFVAARAQGDTEALYRIGDEIAKNYPKTEQLPGIQATLGQMAVARFESDRAIRFLERAAKSGHENRVQLHVAAGELHEALGRYDEAEEKYLQAIDDATPRSRSAALEHYAILLERRGQWGEMTSALGRFSKDGNLDALAREGVAMLVQGNRDGAEAKLQQVLNAGASAPVSAVARAHYGMAEILRAVLGEYPALDSVAVLEEYITVVDVVQQSYLNAVRQGDPSFSPGALLRLTSLVEDAADKLEGAKLTDGLDAEAQAVVKQAIESRVSGLIETADQAVEACQQRVWNGNFSWAVRECWKEGYLATPKLSFDTVSAHRGSGTDNDELRKARAHVAKNPTELESYRSLAEAFLEAGDAHQARIVLTAAQEHGAGPEEQNLLGIACAKVGAIDEALAAFNGAAEAGLEAAHANLKDLLRKEGLGEVAERIDDRYEVTQKGGRFMDGKPKK